MESRRLLTTINEFPVLTANGHPFKLTGGPDGNVWFTELDGNVIGRITPGGTVKEFPIPTAASHPEGITTGPDGNLWFVENGPLSGSVHSKIGQITTEGVILNEFPIATFPSSPTSIVTGSDGNLWFTEFDANSIGRITPSGTITEYAIPGSGNEPESIAAGPDGNLWFTANNGKFIGRITTGGAITQFAYTNYTEAITAGPDGNLWFTDPGTGQIGRITPGTGSIAVFPGGASGNATGLGICKGPDGNLWFTNRGRNEIDQITPAGIITRFSIPTSPSNPVGITTGPDGNIWFTESVFTAGKIGQIVLAAPPPAPDLALSGTAPGSVSLGQNVTYSFTVTNGGSAGATGVTLTDTLPAGVTFVSATGGAMPVGGVLTVDLGNLAAGASDIVTIVVTPTAIGTLNNQADVGGNENDATPADNRVIQTTLVPSFVVNTTDDELTPGDGKISLREAIAFANAIGGQTVTFDPAVFPAAGGALPIQLIDDAAHRTLELKSGMTIVGPGAGVLSVKGGGKASNFSVFKVDVGVTATISGLTVTGGNAANGGGINNSGILTLSDSAVLGNSAVGFGGGIISSVSLTLVNCTIAGNSADIGGGVEIFGTLTMTNTTVTGNSATSAGGGIGSAALLTLTNCTIAGNSVGVAGAGGGIEVFSTLILRNTIVAANIRGAGAGSKPDDILLNGGKVDTSSSYNLIGTGGSGGLASGVNHNLVGLDPLLGPLQDNGGPTPTMALLDGSPAFDAGSNALVPLGVNTDQRGLPRVFNGTVDIGAFESQTVLAAPSLVVNTTADELAVGDGKTSLREAIALANALSGGTITFDPAVFSAAGAATIQLINGAQYRTLELKSDVTIVGPGAKALVIKGGGAASNFSVFKVDVGVTATISGLTVTAGYSSFGGGIYNVGSLTLTDCTVDGNSGTDEGGGIFSQSTLVVTGGTITNNGGGKLGGGLAALGTLTMTNTTVAGNSAVYGGGFYVAQNTATFINCTVAANRSSTDAGGGFTFSDATVTLRNTIVASNFQGAAPSTIPGDIFHRGAAGAVDPASAYNLIGTGGSGGLVNGVNHNLVGVINPKLGPFQDNGGPTMSVALLIGSPAHDAGSNALVPPGITNDQRGLPRFANGVVDIGAYESQDIPAFLAANPLVAGKSAIFITGTPYKDFVVLNVAALRIGPLAIRSSRTKLAISMTLNGVAQGSFFPTSRDVFIAAGEGDNRVLIKGALAGTLKLHALDGDVRVTTRGKAGSVTHLLRAHPRNIR